MNPRSTAGYAMPEDPVTDDGDGPDDEPAEGPVAAMDGENGAVSQNEATESDDVDEDAFGYSVEGTWDEIVGFGELVLHAFERAGLDSGEVDEWQSWRPLEEEGGREMREKAVEQAKMGEGDDAAEKAGEAADHAAESGAKVAEGEVGEAAEKAGKASKKAGEAAGHAGRDAVRGVEDAVYRRIVKTSPLFYETENFNATLERITSFTDRLRDWVGDGERDQEYRMTVKAETDDVENALGAEFERAGPGEGEEAEGNDDARDEQGGGDDGDED